MNSKVLLCLIGVVLCAAYVQADCDEKPTAEEGEVKTFFKNLGCSIKKGAEDLGDASKPIVEKIGTSAKELSASIQNKYHDIKSKLSSDESRVEESAEPMKSDPTEKVPLAPIVGEAAKAAAAQ